jgi:hypothetical protein
MRSIIFWDDALQSVEFQPTFWRYILPLKCQLTLNGLHVISQMILFITTAVKTSNPTYEAHHYSFLHPVIIHFVENTVLHVIRDSVV